jgi:metal iron transporter
MSKADILQIDTIFSLVGFALTINSSILILAGAAFFYNPNATGEPDIPGAFELMKTFIGNGAAIVFAVALLCVSKRTMIVVL